MTDPTTDNAGRSGGAGDARASLEALRAEIAKAVVGQDPAVTGLVVALLCRGHVLLEGVPGVAKTLLVRTLASALELDTKRVQFTPDLMPSDVTLPRLRHPHRRVLLPARPGLHQPPPGGRDQPDPAQDPVVPAGGHGGTPGHGRRHPPPAPRAVPGRRDPEPRRVRGTYPLPEAQLDRSCSN